MLQSAKEAIAFIRRHSVATSAKVHPGIPSMLEEIAGEPISGSWWSHPKGRRIYALYEAIQHSPEILICKLLDGKMTFVHRSLWAPLYRVISDEGWRTRRLRPLPAFTRELAMRVERAGELRLDQLKASRKQRPARDRLKVAKHDLEKYLLVQSDQIHTERGSHATVLRSWNRWATAGLTREASNLTCEDALREIRLRCGAAADALEVETKTARRLGRAVQAPR